MTANTITIYMQEVCNYSRTYDRDDLAAKLGCEPDKLDDYLASGDVDYEPILDDVVAGFDSCEDREWSSD